MENAELYLEKDRYIFAQEFVLGNVTYDKLQFSKKNVYQFASNCPHDMLLS